MLAFVVYSLFSQEHLIRIMMVLLCLGGHTKYLPPHQTIESSFVNSRFFIFAHQVLELDIHDHPGFSAGAYKKCKHAILFNTIFVDYHNGT